MSLANQSLKYDSELNDDCNVLQLIRKFIPTHECDISSNKEKIKKQCQEYYDRISKVELGNMSKAESYRLYKSDTKVEKYLSVITNNRNRKALSRFHATS